MARIGVSRSGSGFNALGEGRARGAEAVGSASPGIDDDGFQSVLGLEPVPDEIPERDGGDPKPRISSRDRGKARQGHNSAEHLDGLIWSRSIEAGG